MRTAGRWLVVGWLAVALVLLGIDDRLAIFLAWTNPSSLLGLGVGALVRHQRAPSILDQPPDRTATELPTISISRWPP
jgi:hypothetical protein